MKVLVINCGSSSLKFQLIDSASECCLAKGLCERIGIDGSMITYAPEGAASDQLCLYGRQRHDTHNILPGTASGQVIDRLGNTLQHRPVCVCTAKPFYRGYPQTGASDSEDGARRQAGFCILYHGHAVQGSGRERDAAIFSSLPIIIISAIPSSIIFAAAISVLLSLDSGSTIVFLSILALSLIVSI